ncbi:hypothetical protein GGS23DRAFT_38536 [Durotheca rogersii]|uniref:uncharacterized protein n=1 Tax=Durotheca rogersii TaxID=419775 RepID=UPI0022208F7A|nr:uncharacterized protein GGS23DRAFT_38536 [Durotheca rogersii]KAI5868589.1 hypothetical protein GGS23DRAFT_38536 [Durotheca rogersii]
MVAATAVNCARPHKPLNPASYLVGSLRGQVLSTHNVRAGTCEQGTSLSSSLRIHLFLSFSSSSCSSSSSSSHQQQQHERARTAAAQTRAQRSASPHTTTVAVATGPPPPSPHPSSTRRFTAFRATGAQHVEVPIGSRREPVSYLAALHSTGSGQRDRNKIRQVCRDPVAHVRVYTCACCVATAQPSPSLLYTNRTGPARPGQKQSASYDIRGTHDPTNPDASSLSRS